MTSNEYRKIFKQEISDLLYYGKGFTDYYVNTYMTVSQRKAELKRLEDRVKQTTTEKSSGLTFNENMSIEQIKSKAKSYTTFNSPK